MKLSNEIITAIKQRRSIKPFQFDSNEVNDEAVWAILEAATYAPTHGNTQPWHYEVFTKEAKKRLGEKKVALYKAMTSKDKFSVDKFNKIGKLATLSSHVIAICMKRQVSERIPETEEVASVACAVQNLHLAAHSLGLAGYWMSAPLVYSDEMKSFLGLADKDKCLGFFYLGRRGKNPETPVRDPVSTKVNWHNQ